MKKWIKPILWLLLIASIAVPRAAFAQMEGGGREGMMGGGMMGGGMPMMQKMMGMHSMDGGMMEMMKMMQAMSRLDLTPDQKKKIESLKLKHQKEAIPLFSKIEMANVEIKELILADPVDLEKVKAKVKEKHAAMADLEASHLALAQQMKGVLTPEQRQKMESMIMELGPMMGGPSGKDKAETGAKPAPKEPEGDASEGGDPHGH
ncbi:Spy/CpxP family protein refolding chaperone [Candidatus Manganitrophus noduliformans]|nr:periplasmic heavy metal sensor [Candidatus Manganitrophus noduliformans]